MKQRIAWIDNLKAFLILLVVLGHCIQDIGFGDDSLLCCAVCFYGGV